ncbi:MAG: MnmC family methyltransferase [Desulfuromonadales bacterium]|nr:MnmC family methyltransferase [Desulfuromonadales bacterium]
MTASADDALDGWELIETAKIPGDGGAMQLYQREDEFSISVVGSGVLMNTWAHQSEDALAERACRRIRGRSQPRVLIGGLGMGFTLAAALRFLGPDAVVEVAELVPAVVTWNRGPLGSHAGQPLHDERTQVRVGDVAKIIRAQRQAYDAILLDVDNGPNGFTSQKNDWLYTTDGLTEAYTALRPAGILAVWSAGPSRNFRERLRKVGFTVQQCRVPEQDNQGDLHAIWLAERGP